MPSNPAADVNIMASAKTKMSEFGSTLAEAKRVLGGTLVPVSGRFSKQRAESRHWVTWLFQTHLEIAAGVYKGSTLCENPAR